MMWVIGVCGKKPGLCAKKPYHSFNITLMCLTTCQALDLSLVASAQCGTDFFSQKQTPMYKRTEQERKQNSSVLIYNKT